jgi:hypothetical protein
VARILEKLDIKSKDIIHFTLQHLVGDRVVGEEISMEREPIKLV